VELKLSLHVGVCLVELIGDVLDPCVKHLVEVLFHELEVNWVGELNVSLRVSINFSTDINCVISVVNVGLFGLSLSKNLDRAEILVLNVD